MNRSIAPLGLLLLGLLACGPPDPAEWARKRAKPFAVEPGAAAEELEPLRGLVGEARLVLLGQPTYGTRETSQAARRIAEFLMAEQGFTVLALETGANEARRIDEWVQGGEDTGRQALLASMEWSLASEEMLAFLRGLRERNASGQGSIHVKGFGLPHSRATFDAVRSVLSTLDPALAQDFEVASEMIALGTGQVAPRAEVTFSAAALVGQTIRSSGFIRTDQVTGGNASLSWEALDASGSVLLATPMEGARPSGTTGWIRYDVWMKVPERTERVRVAMNLSGEGRAWFDGLHLLADNEPYEWGIDLDFESDAAAKDLTLHGLKESSGITREEFQHGKASLALVSDLAAWRARLQEILPLARVRSARVLELLESTRAALPQGLANEDLEWALAGAQGMAQQIDVLGAGNQEQSEALPAATLDPVKEARERALAEGVQRIVESSPEGTKIAVWTHNLHASQGKGRMGSLLSAKYGEELLSLGSAFYEGTYRALGPRGPADHEALRPPADSVETSLHGTHLPSFLLDLRASQETWLEPRPFRAIGPRVSEEQFHAAALAADFDVLLYVDRTTPTKVLGVMGD